MCRHYLAIPLAISLLAVGSPAGSAPETGSSSVVFEKSGCIIHPLRTVVVSSQATGVIVKMPVEEQDVVTAGQLIAQLDDTLARLTVARLRLIAHEDHTVNEAKIRLDQAKEDYETAKKLAARLPPSEVRAAGRKYELAGVIVQRAAYQRALAQIELQQADKRLEDHHIRAPIDGVVLIKHRERGESVDVDTQTPVVTLIDVSKLRAEVRVPVENVTLVRLNQRATVTPEVFPDRTIEGRVVFIEPVVRAEDDKFKVKVEFTDPEPIGGTIRPGMRAVVRILAAG